MQQVNLYTDAFRPKKVVLPLEHIIAISVVVLLLLVLVSFIQNMGLESDRETLADLNEKAEVMNQRVAKMEEEVRSKVLDESLVAANERLKEKVKAREEMVKVLDSLVLEDGKGIFSDLMVALARQNSNDLWLNHINVGLGGKTMSLEGTTLSAEQVPAYLQRLREEPAFLGRTFTLFQLNVDDKRKAQLNFELKSEISNGESEQESLPMKSNAMPVMSIGGV